MPNTCQPSRRRFLKLSLSVAAAWTLGQRSGGAGETKAPPKLPVGLQLYAVRGSFSRDVPGTLERIGKLGYSGVEFWGYGGTPNVYQKYGAKELRRLLDDNGLRCCGMHLQLKALESANLQRTVENNRTLGNKYLIVAAARNKMGSEESIKSLAAFLTETAARLKSKGMRVGYHAHGFDFQKIGGRFAWEILFSLAGPEVVMQMDVGNCLGGGGDPIGMMKKFPGRTTTIHIKEYKEKTFDSDYYTEIFRLCKTSERTEWLIVEAGDPGGKGLNTPRTALVKLRRLGY